MSSRLLPDWSTKCTIEHVSSVSVMSHRASTGVRLAMLASDGSVVGVLNHGVDDARLFGDASGESAGGHKLA